MSKPTATHTDFDRVLGLAQTTLSQDIISTPSASIVYHGQTIALMTEPDLLWLKCPADQKVLLLDISPEIYFETDDLIGKCGVLIRLSQITNQELSLRLSDAAASR